MKFDVEHMEHGVLITGMISLPELAALTSAWDIEGLYEVADMEIGQMLGGLAITNRAGAAKWKKELQRLRMKVIDDDTSRAEKAEEQGEGADATGCP